MKLRNVWVNDKLDLINDSKLMCTKRLLLLWSSLSILLTSGTALSISVDFVTCRYSEHSLQQDCMVLRLFEAGL